jgi:phage baseplate assembly protein W
MFDLQVLRLQDAVKVTKVEESITEGPKLYRIHGEDFRSVEEVVINDVTVPAGEFIVLSKTRLIAAAPPEVQTDPFIRSVLVLSSTFTATGKSLLKFQVTTNKVDGLLRLSQLFAKVLLTAPGTDIYDPKVGGNLHSLIGTSADKNGTGMAAAFTQIVNRTKEQILAMQAGRPRIPIAERLASARVVAVNFDPDRGELQGRVQLTSIGGRAAVLNLGI